MSINEIQIRKDVNAALRSLDMIGEGDWTPQDTWLQKCATHCLDLLQETASLQVEIKILMGRIPPNGRD